MRTSPCRALVFAAILSCTGAACSIKPEGLPATAGRGDTKRAADIGTGVFGEPIVLEGSASDYVLVPYSLVKRESGGLSVASSGFSLSGSYSGGSSFSLSEAGLYRRARNTHWNNALLYDKRTGAARLLLADRAVIVEALLPSREDAKGRTSHSASQPPLPPHVLIACARADTNRDHVINEADAVVLYHVDLATLKMTPLTPEGAQFDEATPDDGGRVLYVRSITDTNSDRAFTETDDAAVTRVDLTKPALGTPIVSDELRKIAFSIIAGAGK
jgi:hypothetical protein